MDPVTAMVRHQTRFAQHLRGEIDKILEAQQGEGPENVGTYRHESYQYGALCLAVLYKLDHPENTLRGKAWLRDEALRLLGPWIDRGGETAEEREAFMSGFCEWPSFILGQVVELFGDELDAGIREEAFQLVSGWVAFAYKKPFGKTSPNHESWRFGSMYRCGKAFGKPEWQERALKFFKQLCTLQTPEGFWEEGRHHGPSMKYNCLMLSPLAYVYRLSGEQWLGDAATGLAKFMSTWTFPDGTTAGLFDGRQSTSPAFWAPACPGLELVPEGVTLNQRGAELWDRRRMLSEERALGPSNWYTHFGVFFTADTLRYFGEQMKETETVQAAPLAVDHREARLQHKSPYFAGTLRRWGPWLLGLSGQESDVPKDGESRYRLERQSRIELWHEKSGVILGGGHNMIGWPVPHANVQMHTGFEGEVNFGEAKPAGEKMTKLLYMPRTIEASAEGPDDSCTLALHFAHGTVTFNLRPDGDARFLIEAAWDLTGVERLNLQLPFLMWRLGDARADGNPLEAAKPALSQPVSNLDIGDSIAGTRVEVALPEVGKTRLRLGLEPLRSYGPLFEHENFDTPFHIIMASTQLDHPPATGVAKWTLSFHTA